MSHIRPAHDIGASRPSGVAPALVLLMAAGAGFAVASLYYNQPMLGILGPSLNASPGQIGLVPTLTQLGYALGILLLSPLGDRFDRRIIILVKAVALMLVLGLSAVAPGIHWLLAASLATGIAATLAQDIIPGAATLAPDAQRGKVVGSVMTGLLLGILLSRVVSGVVAEIWGWRAMYGLAALGVFAIAIGLWRGLPAFTPTSTLSYGGLMLSLASLWRRYPALRQAVVVQALLALGFSAFWSTLAVMLHGRYGMGAAESGLFGLAGAAGAVAAPLAGRLADRRGPAFAARLGAGLTALSFAAMAFLPGLPVSAQMGLIVASTIGFDLGIQATLVAHQTIIYSIDPAARSRLNALLFTGMFIGMASGAALGSAALMRWDWAGVVMVATSASVLALLLRLRVWR